MKRLLNLFIYKKEKTPFFLKWTNIQQKIVLAKTYNDFKALQNLREELQWMVSLYNFHFKKELSNFHYANSNFGALLVGKTSDDDKSEVEKIIYRKLKIQDFEIPQVFDINNSLHYNFCEDITADLERVIFRTLENNENFEEKNLIQSKEFIHKALSFLEHCDHSNNKYVDKEYFNELKLKLKKFE